jgi:hypothetical protein
VKTGRSQPKFSRNVLPLTSESVVEDSAFRLAYSSTLKMEAVHYSEALVYFYLITLRNIPDNGTSHGDCCENLKSKIWIRTAVILLRVGRSLDRFTLSACFLSQAI